MKLNWGLGIAITFILFVIFIGYLVSMAFRQNIDLVHEDYYVQELNYQKHINRAKNAAILSEKVLCTKQQNDIIVKFPASINSEKIEGEVFFFRPSDKKKDVKEALHLNKGEQHFPLSLFSSGLYKIKITWESNGIGYFKEETIVL